VSKNVSVCSAACEPTVNSAGGGAHSCARRTAGAVKEERRNLLVKRLIAEIPPILGNSIH